MLVDWTIMLKRALKEFQRYLKGIRGLKGDLNIQKETLKRALKESLNREQKRA